MHTLARLPAFVAVGFLALWLSGCTTRVYGYTDTVAYASGPGPAVTYVDTDPDLVVLDDGVYVVCDQADTVYYTGGAYWYYGGGVWYRSTVWGGPRVRVGIGYVPVTIRGRSHWRYRRYNAPAHLRVRYSARRYGRYGRYGRRGGYGRTDVSVRTRGRATRPRATSRRPASRRPATRPNTRRPDTRRPNARRPDTRWRTQPRRTMPTPRARQPKRARPRPAPNRGREVVFNDRSRRRTAMSRRKSSSRTTRQTTVSRRGGGTKVTRSRTKTRGKERSRTSRRSRRR